MATTGELLAIVEELELIDIGDAASYLGEESGMAEDAMGKDVPAFSFVSQIEHITAKDCAMYRIS